MKHQPEPHKSQIAPNQLRRELNLINDQRLQNRWDFSLFLFFQYHLRWCSFASSSVRQDSTSPICGNRLIRRKNKHWTSEPRRRKPIICVVLRSPTGQIQRITRSRVLLIHWNSFLFPGFPKITACCNFAKIFRLWKDERSPWTLWTLCNGTTSWVKGLENVLGMQISCTLNRIYCFCDVRCEL